MADDLPPLIEALCNPLLYPDAAGAVEVVQTHGAWVILAGTSAYKIKKPVRFDFMDFSTLALRRAACLAELRVNQRFAPADPALALYRQVLPIVGPPQAPRWGHAGLDEPRAIEFAVHMRRFDQDCRADRQCQRGLLRMEHMVQLARDLARWQDLAPAASADSPWGLSADLLTVVQDNLQALGRLLLPGDDLPALQALADTTLAAWPAQAPLLQARRLAGRVREGHGDLHLANLVLQGKTLLPFDAIEFDEHLRWVDVASDLAFTWMDLQRMEHPGLAHVLLSEWIDASGDVQAPQVLPFFAVYLALVRAKVAAIRRGQLLAAPRSPPLDELAQEINRCLSLAHSVTRPPPVQLLITHGLSGCGKSHAAAQWLLGHSGSRALRLRSDVERKRLHGLSALQASSPSERVRLYSPEASERTYASLHQRAGDLLQAGWTVLVDAAFLRLHERQAFARLAADLGCPFAILAPQAPVDVLRQRLLQRQSQGLDPSEATLGVLEQQLQWIEPLAPHEQVRVLQ